MKKLIYFKLKEHKCIRYTVIKLSLAKKRIGEHIMETHYTLNEIAMMTGLTTRTLRNYIKMNILKGEKLDGVWAFTKEEFAEFIQNPYVKPSLQAKNKAVVFDFLAQNEKRTNEICTVIDVYVDSNEAEEISMFFCEEVNKRKESNINFSLEKNGPYVRVILRGYEDTVMEILNAYYN